MFDSDDKSEYNMKQPYSPTRERGEPAGYMGTKSSEPFNFDSDIGQISMIRERGYGWAVDTRQRRTSSKSRDESNSNTSPNHRPQELKISLLQKLIIRKSRRSRMGREIRRANKSGEYSYCDKGPSRTRRTMRTRRSRRTPSKSKDESNSKIVPRDRRARNSSIVSPNGSNSGFVEMMESKLSLG